MARTGFVYHPDYLTHEMGAGHPESPDRLRAIVSRLEAGGVLGRLVRIEPTKAAKEWITQGHAVAYLKDLKTRAPVSGYVSLDRDTSMAGGSLPAAYLAAGGALAAVEASVAGRGENVC